MPLGENPWGAFKAGSELLTRQAPVMSYSYTPRLHRVCRKMCSECFSAEAPLQAARLARSEGSDQSVPLMNSGWEPLLVLVGVLLGGEGEGYRFQGEAKAKAHMMRKAWTGCQEAGIPDPTVPRTVM